ncbi:hypothetical protein ACQP00_13665 [Dactylosporangium sp. CS-047395]|uniref:hypothetical protein n=1 Tax=Dactylosporangium sp. CS-047395 TaxID=3239936 RepID=UPI003D8FB466
MLTVEQYLARERVGRRLVAGALGLLLVTLIGGVIDAAPASMVIGIAGAIGSYILWIPGSLKIAADFRAMAANFLGFLALAIALLFAPRILLLEHFGVERVCVVTAIDVGSSTNHRTHTRTPANDITLDCPNGRFEIGGAYHTPIRGDQVPVTFDVFGVARPQLTSELAGSTWWMWPATCVPLGLLVWQLASIPRRRRETLRRLAESDAKLAAEREA